MSKYNIWRFLQVSEPFFLFNGFPLLFSLITVVLSFTESLLVAHFSFLHVFLLYSMILTTGLLELMLNLPRAVSQMIFAAVKKLVQTCSMLWQLGLGVESTHVWLALDI